MTQAGKDEALRAGVPWRAALRVVVAGLTVGATAGLAYVFVPASQVDYTAFARVAITAQEPGSVPAEDGQSLAPVALVDELYAPSFVHDVMQELTPEAEAPGAAVTEGREQPITGLTAVLQTLPGVLGWEPRAGTAGGGSQTEHYRRLVSAYAVAGSPHIVIEFTDATPARAASGANTVADVFVERVARSGQAEANVATPATPPAQPNAAPLPVARPLLAAGVTLVLTAFILFALGVRRRARKRRSSAVGHSNVAPRMDRPADIPADVANADWWHAPLQEAVGVLHRQRQCQVLVATASQDQPRPLVARELARRLAADDRRVILVDLYRDRAQAGAADGDEVILGLNDLIAGTASFSDAIHSDETLRCHFITAGSGPMPEGEGTQALDIALSALVMTYDCVVVDAPIHHISDVGAHCATGLLVADDLRSSGGANAARLMAAVGIADRHAVVPAEDGCGRLVSVVATHPGALRDAA